MSGEEARQTLIQVNLIMPFLATLGASLTIIFLQFIARHYSNRQKKLYAVTCIADISYRILYSELFLKKNTVLPHIEAAKRIIAGDKKLLETMFLVDEFDVLNDAPFDFEMLSEEQKILLGIDNIDLLQAYGIIVYSSKNDNIQKVFNEFVKNNLKSAHSFDQKSPDIQRDILNTYWDYLEKILRGEDRTISFIVYILVPYIKKYAKRIQLPFFSSKSLGEKLKCMEEITANFQDIIPDKSFFEKIDGSGIQKVL